MSSKKRWTSLLIAAGGFILMAFQNCAPGPGSGVIAASDGEVRIVDRWAQNKVQFMAASYFVDPGVDTVNIRGFCKDSESGVQWEAVRAASQGEVVLGEGQVNCENGSFSVNVAVTDQELGSCADSMQLRASVSNEEALTQLRLACL